MSHQDSKGETRYPCGQCDNCYFMDTKSMRHRYRIYGFSRSYETWTYHSEPLIPLVVDFVAPSNEMTYVINDVMWESKEKPTSMKGPRI